MCIGDDGVDNMTAFDDLTQNKRNCKVFISNQAEDKVMQFNITDISEFDNNLLQLLTKKVLSIAREENNSDEVSITCKLGYSCIDDIEFGITIGDEHDVGPEGNPISYSQINFSGYNDCGVVISHNHPSLSSLSLNDIGFFLTKDSIKIIIAVTNLGKVFYLNKRRNYKRSDAFKLLNDALTLDRESTSLKEKQNAANYFLHNAYRAGIEFYC